VISYKAYCVCIRRPDRKGSTDKSAIGFPLYMCAEYIPEAFVTTFCDEMEIEFTQR
jgi:hypothetical protein